ncbi:RDD family protein [Candidatus Bathyarchaeota archaeon]|nr:RDD family protein [Candidatus Bathyarchaeota archaeon]
MSVNEENVSRVLVVLSHHLRREILMDLDEKGECSFTDLMHAHNVDTGKLSFHIRSLKPFTKQTKTGKYTLNKTGENAIRLIKDLEFWAEEAEVAKKDSMLPLASFKKRAYATLIDFFLILTITVGITLQFDLNSIFMITLTLLWVYLTLLEGFRGQSLGKRILGLKVIRTDEKPLSYDYAAVRNFGKAFLLPIDLLIGMRLKDNRFIRYFDKFAGTTVIDMQI